MLTEYEKIRFYSKFCTEEIRFAKSVCWIWKGTCITNGYGTFDLRGKSIMAHRTSYEIFKGNIPKGLVLDHLCRNRKCVNPFHLEPVTNKENILRGFGPPAMNSRKINCKRGHPLSEGKLTTSKSGKLVRTCRICSNVSKTKYRLKIRLLKK